MDWFFVCVNLLLKVREPDNLSWNFFKQKQSELDIGLIGR